MNIAKERGPTSRRGLFSLTSISEEKLGVVVRSSVPPTRSKCPRQAILTALKPRLRESLGRGIDHRKSVLAHFQDRQPTFCRPVIAEAEYAVHAGKSVGIA